MKSRWEHVYHFICKLEKKFFWRDGEKTQQDFNFAVFSHPERPDRFKEARNFINPSLMDDVMTAREYLEDLHYFLEKVHWGKKIFEDVYQAAVYLKYVRHSAHIWYEDKIHLFRGQRNEEWKIIPTIFRDIDQISVIKQRFLSLSNYVRGLQDRIPTLTENQAVAIVQHYSTELKLSTWLVDFTWDPLVALFFASLDGQQGERGIMFYISQNEWNRLSAKGSNIFGPIEIIEVPNIYRIEAQKALFLKSPQPDLFSETSPYSFCFKQHVGLIFEDPNHDPPITEEFLIKKDDPFIETLLKIKPFEKSGFLKSAPPPLALHPLEAKHYFLILGSWCEQKQFYFKLKMWECLAAVCDVYYRLQKLRKIIEDTKSIHHLFRAMEYAQVFYDELIERSRLTIIDEITNASLFEHSSNEKLNSILNDVKFEIQNNEDYFKSFNSKDFNFFS